MNTTPVVPSKPTPPHPAAPKPKALLPVPMPKPAKTKSATDTSSGILARILALIGQEVGLEPSELKPESEFTELGIDSLLSLTITSKIRGELGLDFPPSLFIDCTTIGDLQVRVGGADDDSLSTTSSSSSSSGDKDAQETHLTSSATSVYQDASQQDASSGRTRATLIMRKIIAEETRVPIDDLRPSTSLGDIGIDSLLSLTISGKLQELLDVDIPNTMFMEVETIQELEEALCKVLGLGPAHQIKLSKPSSDDPLDFNSSFTPPGDTQYQSNAVSSLPRATSILLSGSPQTAQLILILFPDGSGSASSYAALAPVVDTSRVAVYGLNCPWRKTGAEMTRLGVTMSTMVARYVIEVQQLVQQQQQLRARPPLIALGGWSAGGILAFEAARQLQQQPEAIRISRLILFDSPNPIGLQNPPQRMYDFFNSLGIFGGGKTKTPEWLQAHFNAFLRILDAYQPSTLPDTPTSLIVYARDGVCKDPDGPKMETRPDDPREMLWLLNNRTDFSAQGWASVLGPEKLSVRVLDEVNHFSLMDRGPKMKEMGQIVTKFCLESIGTDY